MTAAGAASIRQEVPWVPGTAAAPLAAIDAADNASYVFFTPTEAAFIEAAVARLIPDDDLGPGALKAGVPTFIDRQLAGDYGRAASWYLRA